MTDQSSIWQLSKAAQGAVPRIYTNKNRQPQTAYNTPRTTRPQSTDHIPVHRNNAYTPRQLATESPDSQLQWDREGEFSMGPRTYNTTYSVPHTHEPNTSLHPEIQNMAANLTLLEHQQDQLEQGGRPVTNLGSCKIRAGRGRGLRRRVEEKRPGREVNENLRDEEEEEERGAYGGVGEEDVGMEEIIVNTPDGRSVKDQIHRDYHDQVERRAQGTEPDQVEQLNPVIERNRTAEPVQEDSRNRDHVINETAVRNQKGWWKLSGSQFMQWGLALFSALYLIGPSRSLSILYSLPSYEWILTWGSGVFIAWLTAKLMLAFTVFCLGEAAFLSLVYYLCPNRFHVCLYRILGKKPSYNNHPAESASRTAGISSTRYSSPASNSAGRLSAVPDQQTQHSTGRSAHTVGPQSTAYSSAEGQSSALNNRTFTYDREQQNRRDSREDNSGREEGRDFSGHGVRDRSGEERRGRDTYRRTPGSGLTELLRRSTGSGSGGWNGDDFTASTPAARQQTSSRRRNVSNVSSQNRNFRASRNFQELGSHVNFDENRNQEHRYMPSFLSELSMHDQEVIGEHVSASSYAQNVSVKEFDGNYDKYESFRRELMAMVPGIHPRLRLSTLRNALKCKEALRVIEDFVDTDEETFCAALLALDAEYNDIDENAERLLDQIRKIMQSPHIDDEDFVSKFEDLTSFTKRLYKLNHNCKIALDALSKEWIKFVPLPVFNTVKKRLAYDKKWLDFANLFDLCEEFSLSVKHSRGISKERDQMYNSSKKPKHNIYSASSDSSIPPSSEGCDEYDVNYARRSFAKPSIANCCFCNSKEHHSTACPVNMSPEERRNIVFGANTRCLLCLEEGHRVGWCLLVRLKSNIPFKCDCTSDKPTHAKIICEAVRPRSLGI